ncbi:ash family protein [Pasteurella multocida]|uniref:ash family protein n=2 Tax=Pasteurella multocida TaxID=747 RepID=UPI00295B244B|nr:ash family protein [Pasteurella multocida]
MKSISRQRDYIKMLFKISDLFKKSKLKRFTKCGSFWHYLDVSAKSLAERGNSNYLLVANSSTPFNRAFFVREVRTPKIRYANSHNGIFSINSILSIFGLTGFISMVACDWQRLIVGCVPQVAVFHPVARYRPKAWKLLAVTSIQHLVELIAMIYLFKAISRLDLRNTSKPISSFPCYTIRIKADNLEQAKAIVCPFFAVKEVDHA